MTIPDIFAAEGEDGFRRRETTVLAELGKASGTIIATGGGCVTRPENYPLLHQNGTIVWIRRALDKLPSNGRPLSQQNSAQTLYDQRRDKYQAFADLSIDTNENIDLTVATLLARFG
jgi:shikimate dehydrogenase